MLVIQSKEQIDGIEIKFIKYNHEKYITNSEFNNLTAKSFAARLAQENLAIKTDFDTKLMNLNKKINSNKQYMYLLKKNFKN